MANEQQYRLKTQFIATRGVQEYRQTIPTVVTRTDVVLELGCAWGSTTRFLAAQCREIIGTDVSPDCIKRARKQNPDIRFEVIDAFDVRAALELGRPFTKIYMDLSGLSSYRALLDVIALSTMYATVFRPETMVIKSGALKQFAFQCHPWSERADILAHQNLAQERSV